MKVNCEKDRSLQISGPAAVKVLSGTSSVLAAPLSVQGTLTIRKGRSLPIYCESESSFEINLGNEGEFNKFEGNTIPVEWEKSVQAIIAGSYKKNLCTLIVGGVDVGKTTYSIYLVNNCMKRKITVNIIDADIGQSDIGPPATIGTYKPTSYISDLFYQKPDDIVFIGAVTPTYFQEKIIDTVSKLSIQSRRSSNITIINTDGWIDGEDAEDYKYAMIARPNADFTVAIQSSDELHNLIKKLKKTSTQIFELKPSPAVKRRSRDERRKLRWQAYQKYMQNSIYRTIRLDKLKIINEIPEKRDTLIGLYNSRRKFLGLALFKGYNQSKNSIKIFTPLRDNFSALEFGRPIDIETLQG